MGSRTAINRRKAAAARTSGLLAASARAFVASGGRAEVRAELDRHFARALAAGIGPADGGERKRVADWIGEMEQCAFDEYTISGAVEAATTVARYYGSARGDPTQVMKAHATRDQIRELISMTDIIRQVTLHVADAPAPPPPAGAPAVIARRPVVEWTEARRKEHILLAFGSETLAGAENAVSTNKRCPICGTVTTNREVDIGGSRADDGTKLRFKCSNPSCKGHEFS